MVPCCKVEVNTALKILKLIAVKWFKECYMRGKIPWVLLLNAGRPSYRMIHLNCVIMVRISKVFYNWFFYEMIKIGKRLWMRVATKLFFSLCNVLMWDLLTTYFKIICESSPPPLCSCVAVGMERNVSSACNTTFTHPKFIYFSIKKSIHGHIVWGRPSSPVTIYVVLLIFASMYTSASVTMHWALHCTALIKIAALGCRPLP